MAITISGLMSGLDVNNIMDQLKELQQQPITKLQQKEADYQVELTAYGNLRSALAGLKSAAQGLSTAENLTRYSASSGDTDLFTVAADDDPATGTYDITVQQLAKVQKLTSTAFSENEAVGEGTMHLQVGSGSEVDITVSAGDTLEDVAEAVNSADAGVRANVVFDGTDYYLTLASEETGADNVIRLTVTEAGTTSGDPENSDTTGLSRLVYEQGVTQNLTQSQSPEDAVITVDGVADIHRSANVLDDVIDGVTITLKSAPDAPDNSSTLTVSRNTVSTAAAVKTFVKAYNEAMNFIEEYQVYNPGTENAGVLLGDATTNSIRNQLERITNQTLTGMDNFDRLSDVGVSLNAENRLEVDDDSLETALADDFEDVLQFFTQTTEGVEGFAVRLEAALEGFLDTDTGTIAARTDGIQTSIDQISDQIERLEIRNEAWEARTRAQFNTLELLIAEYQTTGDYLSQQIIGMQNLNQNIANR